MADLSSFRNWVDTISVWRVTLINDAYGESMQGPTPHKFERLGEGLWRLGDDEFSTEGYDESHVAYWYGRYRKACRNKGLEPGPFERADED